MSGEPPQPRWDAVVIGGGFFGGALALAAREHLPRVLLVEREPELLQRASYSNQARVHNGYHYPRSLLTGLRSSLNFPRFVSEFADCVDGTVRNYYAVARLHSKVTSSQYEAFCQRIGVPLRPVRGPARKLFNPDLIDEVYEAQEYVFDAVRLKHRVVDQLRERGVEVRTATTALRVERSGADARVTLQPSSASGQVETVEARYVFNCTYSNINELLKSSALGLVPLKHELTEMALVKAPEPLADVGITVMCGPFFSCMPFPPRGLHTLSHVRYTPHGSWEERDGRPFEGPLDAGAFERRSSFPAMMADARRYVPLLGECTHVDSLWEIKTVLPQSESNDSRPILFKRSAELPGLVSVLGGKIDNVYDLPRELDGLLRSAA